MGREEMNPELIPFLGLLLHSVRTSAPEDYIELHIRNLRQMGASIELIETFLQSRLKIELSIKNGAGSGQIAEDIIRFLTESTLKGDHVSTRGVEKVISSGAYMWMSAPNRSTDEDTQYKWHTRGLDRGYEMAEMLADKREDYLRMTSFFGNANEPYRTAFLDAINQDDDGKHEIKTTGRALIRAGLAKHFE